MRRDYGVFHVSLKLLLRRGDEVLILRDDNGLYDLPGGRIDNVEFKVPLDKVIAREVREELGPVRYKMGKAVFQYRAYHEPREIYIFATVYDATYLSGAIRLSDEHSSYQWIKPADFRFARKDFPDVDVWRAYQEYFNGIR